MMRVAHYGNTANNAYYNTRILRDYAGIASELPIRMFGLTHAISAPAWEAVEFDVPSAEWVPHPDWSMFPEAESLNAELTDLPVRAALEASGEPERGLQARILTWGRARVEPLVGRRWAQPIFDTSYRWVLSRRAGVDEAPDRIDLLYGADSLVHLRMPESYSRVVCLEHGTVRAIAVGSRIELVMRQAYREQVARSQHLWVTNLDPKTLEIAEDVAPGRWSAIPHPYLPDPRVPFAENAQERATLLERTKSSALVLVASSQNSSPHHDKGSATALKAFVELRRKGAEIGLVAVEWGLQLAEAKAFLEREGVAQHVTWVAPMARFRLQRTMANVDVVWDQFGLEAFGGLACRAVEQGTPFVSRGLAPVGEQLIGGPVPWLQAASVEDIVRETLGVLEDESTRGRAEVIASTRSKYRSWLLERHSPELTVQLQRDVYQRIVDGSFERGTAKPDAWATALAESSSPTGNSSGEA